MPKHLIKIVTITLDFELGQFNVIVDDLKEMPADKYRAMLLDIAAILKGIAIDPMPPYVDLN